MFLFSSNFLIISHQCSSPAYCSALPHRLVLHILLPNHAFLFLRTMLCLLNTTLQLFITLLQLTVLYLLLPTLIASCHDHVQPSDRLFHFIITLKTHIYLFNSLSLRLPPSTNLFLPLPPLLLNAPPLCLLCASSVPPLCLLLCSCCYFSF